MNPFRHQGQRLALAPLLLTFGLTLSATSLFAQLFVEWNETYGGLGYEEFQTVNKTDDGGYIFGGFTNTIEASCQVSQPTIDTVVWPELTGDVWLIKTDGNGKIEWENRYGGFKQDRMWSVTQTADGGYIIGGESLSGNDNGTQHTELNRGGFDYWLMKIDANGNYQWDRTYGGGGNDILRAVFPMPDGKTILIGYSDSPSWFDSPGDKSEGSRGLSDFWILWVDENGVREGDKTIGGDGNDWVSDALILQDGSLLMAGWSESGISGEKTAPNYGFNDYWLVKINILTGDIIWQETYGGELRDVPLDLFQTANEDIIVVGHSSSATNTGNKTVPHYGLEDGWILRIRDEGNQPNLLWQKAYGGSAADFAYSTVETSLGNLMIVGSSSSEADSLAGGKLSPNIGGSDYWINYLDPNGERLWDMSMGGINADVCTKIIPAHEYGFIFGGHSSSNAYPPFKDDHTCNTNDIYIIRTGCNIEPPGLTADTVTCSNEFITLDATVDSCEFCQYLWDDGITSPIRIIQPNEAADLRITIAHPDGCETTDSVALEITPAIDTMISDFTPIACFGDDNAEFLVEEVQGGVGPYVYKLNDGPWDSLGFYTDLEPGLYTLEVMDTNGCSYDTSFFIEQPQEVLLELGNDITVEYGDSVQVQALTNLLFDFTVEWASGTPLSCQDCLEPWTSIITASTNVAVTVADSNGCAKTDQLAIFTEYNTAVYIPNAFSPNNDNVNDFFTVYGDQTVTKVNHLKVFDRTGELLFERDDFPPNVDQLGYDGRHEGIFMKPQVLAYWAEVEYSDGSTGFFEGDVTLVR